jgi:hypothetical protein
MEHKILCLFNCVLHKQKINQNTFRFSIIARNRDSKFKYIRYQEKIAEDERKIVIFLITGQQLLLYCVE